MKKTRADVRGSGVVFSEPCVMVLYATALQEGFSSPAPGFLAFPAEVWKEEAASLHFYW